MVLNPVIKKLVDKRVVLASSSPRRQEILTNAGLRFEVVPSWFKETLEKSTFSAPYQYAVETAKQKALEVANRMHVKHLQTPDIVIGADTIVTIEEQILEKPVDKQDAYKMLSRLSGKEHSVVTGVAIVHCSSKDDYLDTEVTEFFEETKVKFAELSEELLWEYIHSGEPMDKAGGYGIQALGGMLVEYVHGDFLNVCLSKLTHLLDGFKASKVLFVACKLKVFDLLKDRDTLTTEDAANQLNTSLRGTERLFDACASLGLLEKNNQGYSNAELTNLCLVSNSEYSLYDYILHCNDHLWPLFTHLELAVKEGTSQIHHIFGKKVNDLFQDFHCQSTELKQCFVRAMHSSSKVTARDISTAFDLSQFKVVCDLGGCTGALGDDLVQIYPEMQVIVLDLPEVITDVTSCQLSRQNACEVSFVSGDIFKDNLPEADLYILSRVLHHCSEEKISLLLNKLSAVSKQGVALLIAEILLDEKRINPARAVFQSLSMTEGKERSTLEYKQLLEEHGFSNVQIKITGNLLDVILCSKKLSSQYTK
ncbi:N-acetylserotonin O-methyltransferase-like [Crotalus adamanteus]|uniref:N-acetylserotonin O-methyltransferase-like n=1 Tax=Crotalus adamanteus TaxID=8729 RepID=A0AAW1BII4_CROAD